MKSFGNDDTIADLLLQDIDGDGLMDFQMKSGTTCQWVGHPFPSTPTSPLLQKKNDHFPCGCARNTDCPGLAGAPTCGSTGACICAGDTDCLGNPVGEACLASGSCGCTQNSHCADSGAGPICLASRTCGCSINSDCAGSTVGASCLGNKSCGWCTVDADCSGSGNGPFCVGGYCAPCPTVIDPSVQTSCPDTTAG
jgi:hypothetical protein